MPFRIGDGPDERIGRYEQNTKRPRLERERDRLSDRLRTLTGDARAAVERELASVEAELKRLDIGR